MLLSRWLNAVTNRFRSVRKRQMTCTRHRAARGTSLSAAWAANNIAALPELLEDRVLLAATLNVAVVGNGLGGASEAGYAATVAQLNDSTAFNISATLVAPSDIDTAGELAAYDAVLVGDDGDAHASFATYASALRTYVESGGGLVTVGWAIFANAATGQNSDLDSIVPVNAFNFDQEPQAPQTVTVDVTHPVTSGITAVVIADAGDYLSLPTSSLGHPQVDPGAIKLASRGTDAAVVVANVSLGRSAYLPFIYTGKAAYSTTELRSGAADQLLEQAVFWAGRGVATTATVSPGSMGSWAIDVRDSNGDLGNNSSAGAAFVVGPTTPPIGTGSINLFTGNGTEGGDGAAELRNTSFVNTPLSALTSLSYDTYASSWNGQQLPYLGLELDLDGDDQYDDIIFFEPAYQTPTSGNPSLPNQGSEALNSWQHWDALVGGWWSNNGIAGANPGTDVKSLTDYLAAEPNAKIVNRANGLGGVRFTVGFASASDVFNGNIDNITIGTTSSTAFDFEYVPPPITYANAAWAGTNLGLDPDGPGPATVFGGDAFATIQGAINAVENAGTVYVSGGTYTENVNVNKSVTLLGANAGTPGNSGARVAESVVAGGFGTAVNVAANDVTVDGFQLTGITGLQNIGYNGLTVQNNLINSLAFGVTLQDITTATGHSLTIHDNKVTLATQEVAGPTSTVGVVLSGIHGSVAPVISGNDVVGAGVGYLLYSVDTSPITTLAGGNVTGALQGVVVLNLDPVTFTVPAATQFVIDGMTMSGFTGHSSNLGQDFHAGVYVFTGGSNASAIVTGTVRNVTISDTGKTAANSAGLSFSDFSTNSGVRQQISIETSTIENNLNRGLLARGANADVHVTQSTFTNNGFDPFGAGGNDGFGVFAFSGAHLSVNQSFVTNPTTTAAPYSVYAVGSNGSSVTINNSSIDNNGNPSGYLAVTDTPLDGSSNWWGTNDSSNFTQTFVFTSAAGAVDYTPWFDDGTDTDPLTVGFQGDYSTLWVDDDSPQTGFVEPIAEAYAQIGNPGTLNVLAGTYSEPVDFSTTAITLSPGAGPGKLDVNGVTLTSDDALNVEVNGSVPGTGYDQLNVTGTVDLGGATLTTSGSVTSSPGQQIVLIANDGTDAITGAFAGLSEGDTVTINSVVFFLSYSSGSNSNDVTLTEAGPVIFTSDGVGAGALELRLVGGNVQFVDDGVVVDSRPLASLIDQTVTVNGSDPADDTLLVNYALGGFFDVDIVFNGGSGVGGSDTLIVDGGTFTSVTHTFTLTGPEHSGDISYDTGTAVATIGYTGLEPVDMTGSTITDLVFNLPVGAANDFNLEDDGNLVNGQSRILSNGGLFETTLFSNPTGSLTINAGGLGDYFNLYQLDDGFTAPITFNGGAGADRMYVHTTASSTTIPAGGVSFVGSGNNDGFAILPGYVATTIAHSFTNSNDGSVNIDGSTINYDDMNVAVGIYDQLTATNRTFQFAASNDTISFGDDPTANDNFSRISSNGSVTTDFKNPSSTFVLNGGDGDDTITIGSFAGMDAQFVAAVTIDGEGDTDSITQNSAMTLGSGASTGNLSLTAESIDLNATIDTTAGSVGDVTLSGTDISINAAINAGGNVSATATNNIDLTGGSITTSGDAAVSAGNALTTDVAGTDITAANAALGGGAGGIGSSTNPIRLSVDTLVSDSNGVIDGDQFLVESGSLDIGAADLDAGTATISLLGGAIFTTTTGSILSNTVVASGVLLGGNGTVTGSVNVANGGTVSPGNLSTAILNTGSLTLVAGAMFDTEVNGNVVGTTYDQLNVTGTVNLGGATLNAFGTVPSVTGQVIVLVNNDGSDPVIGTFAGLAEGDTVFINSIGFKLSYAGGTGNDVTLTQLIQVTVVASPLSLNEDAPDLFVFTFTRDGILDLMTVNYAITGSATFVTDYTQQTAGTFNGVTGTVVFGFGQTTAIVYIDPKQDAIIEPDETVTFTLLPGSNYVPAIPNIATVTIIDDDINVSVSAAPASVLEDSGTSIDYTFTRTGVLTNSLTVAFSVNGTATFGTDYTQIGATTFANGIGTVTFAPNSATAVVSITPSVDSTVELDETVRIGLTAGTGYNVITPNIAIGTILNDDVIPVPSVTVAVSPSSVAEDGSPNLVYTFTRTLTTDPLTVNFTIGGGATFVTDYTQSGAATFDGVTGTITFGFGQSTATVIVNPKADSIVEADEDVVLTVVGGSGYNVGGSNVATGTIANDDFLPTITLAVSPASVMENGAPNLLYTFTRTGATNNALTVNFTVGGTATLASDYTQSGAASFNGSTGSVTFGFGQSTATVVVNPKSDGTVEADETVVLTLASNSNYTVGTVAPVIGTILNDDIGVSVAVSPTLVNEDSGNSLTYSFTRVGPTNNPLTVKFAVNGTAKFGTDYTQTGAASFGSGSGTIVIPAFSTTATVEITPTVDSIVEADETVKLTVATGSGYAINSPSVAIGTIANDDIVIPPTVSLTVSPASVFENGSPNLIYTFTRTTTTLDVLTVNFTVGGTATFVTDYTQTGATTFSAGTGTIKFGFGQTAARVTINPRGDSTAEADETVTLDLAVGAGYVIGAPSSAIGTILNDDGPLTPVVTVAASPSIALENGTDRLLYTFTRTSTNPDPLTINFTVGGTATFVTDYTQSGASTFNGSSGTIAFGFGQTTARITIVPKQDNVTESTEDIILSIIGGLGYSIGGSDTATGMILDI